MLKNVIMAISFFLLYFGLTMGAGAHTNVTIAEAKQMVDTNSELIIVDVRNARDYCTGGGHIPGALNYPWNPYGGELVARYTELPVDGDILVVCATGALSELAANFLDSKSYLHVYDMSQGLASWPYERVGCVDSDSDGINDDLDNCPADANANQQDSDGDEVGDVCDPDNDNDGICDEGKSDPSCTGSDNCPYTYNPTQENADGDAAGDACDTCTDTDNDGYGNPGFPVNTCQEDNCPDVASSNQNDTDGDCIGDVCDPEPDVYDLSVPDIYPPGGNGCGDECECLADCTNDQKVNLADLLKVKEEFNRSNCATIPCTADCNYDGKVNLADLLMMKGEFGRSDCPACP